MNKLLITLLSFCFGTTAIFSEEIKTLSFEQQTCFTKEPSKNKTYILLNGYGVGYYTTVFPGVSLSIRDKFISYDFSFNSLLMVNSFSSTVSPTLYFSSSKYRPHLSVGAGPMIIFGPKWFSSGFYSEFGVIVPARLGIENDKFAADIGVSAAWFRGYHKPGFMPEVRFGVGF